jgi:predicted transcriptional regulator
MTTLTVRIKEDLKNKAAHQAEKLGIPLTLIVTTALKNFVDSPQIVIGKPEIIKVTPALQKKMDKVAKLMSKKSKS